MFQEQYMPEKLTKYILPLILVLAFALRLKNIWFGYPLQLHPDEPVIVQSALNIISTGDMNPHNFLYPSLNIYLNALLYKTVSLVENVILRISTDAKPEIHYYLYGRALNVLFSTASIYVVYDIGKRLFNPWSGIAAACFIAASSLHVGNSYFVTVDTSMAFWCTLACLIATLIYTKGAKTSYYLAGGVCVGFAIGCKYTAFPAFLPILVAHVYQSRQERNFTNKNIILAAAVVPVAFLLTTPYALLDYRAFLSALAYQKREYSIGHPGAESFYGLSIGNYCKYLFTEGYGIIPSILALAGIPVLYRNSRSCVLLLLSFPLAILVFLGMYKVYFPRNVVTLIPFLSLFSGYTVVAASTWCGHKISDWMKTPKPELVTFVCGALLVAISIQGQVIIDVKQTRENSLPDTRWVSLLWCKDNIPAGASIGREHYTPPLEKHSGKHNVVKLGYFGVVRKSEMIPNLDFVIASSSDYSRFLDNPERYPTEALRYNDFFARNKLVKEFSADGKTMTGPTIRIHKIDRN
jgi:hypothetical protein